MKKNCLFVFLMGCMTPAMTESAPWNFAVFGDSRSGEPPGVNTDIVSRICAEIVRLSSNEPCAAAIFVGDLIRGQLTTCSNIHYAAMYQTAREALAPLYNEGIPFYPCRGNHETYHNPLLPGNVTPDHAWRKAFSNELPANGPTNELFMTYSFVTNNALFISMDQYDGNQNTTYYHRMAGLPWMTNLLAMNTNPFVFVYGHTPAFAINTAAVNDCLLAYPADRDRFWDALGNGGVRAYFTGHSHVLSLGEATDYYAHVVSHLLIGNGGARLDLYDGDYFESNRLEQLYYDSTYHGFCWVTVDGATYRVESHELNTNDYTWHVNYTYSPVAVREISAGPAAGMLALTFNTAAGAGNTAQAYPDMNSLAARSGGTNLWQAYITEGGLLTNISVSPPDEWPQCFISIDENGTPP